MFGYVVEGVEVDIHEGAQKHPQLRCAEHGREIGLIPLDKIPGIPIPWQQLKGNAYYIRRFDRGPNSKRIHIEDFNQLYGQFPEAKNKNYSYTNMATDLWRLTDETQFAEFVRRLVFNVGIGNNDMHLKNWSLIYPDGRTPQLAPAYDFVSTVRYIADDQLALSIAKEKAPNQLNQELLERFARKAQISHHYMSSFIGDLPARQAAALLGVVNQRLRNITLPIGIEQCLELHRAAIDIPVGVVGILRLLPGAGKRMRLPVEADVFAVLVAEEGGIEEHVVDAGRENFALIGRSAFDLHFIE